MIGWLDSRTVEKNASFLMGTVHCVKNKGTERCVFHYGKYWRKKRCQNEKVNVELPASPKTM